MGMSLHPIFKHIYTKANVVQLTWIFKELVSDHLKKVTLLQQDISKLNRIKGQTYQNRRMPFEFPAMNALINLVVNIGSLMAKHISIFTAWNWIH